MSLCCTDVVTLVQVLRSPSACTRKEGILRALAYYSRTSRTQKHGALPGPHTAGS